LSSREKVRKRKSPDERRELLENSEAHKIRASKRTRIYESKELEYEQELRDFLNGKNKV
jgi:hypothetical protein